MSSSPSAHRLQDVFQSRRMLLRSHYLPVSSPAPPPSLKPHDASSGRPPDNSFDANVVMVLSVLLCALICSLGLNSIIRCALRCSRLASNSSSEPGGNSSNPRLANKGVKRKALKKFPTVSFSSELTKVPGLDTECAICLSEFAQGERVRLLPRCNHGFHVRCIDKWLSSHSSCPTCRHCLIEACKKVAAGPDQASSSSAPPQDVSMHIAPHEPEGILPRRDM